MTQEQMERMHSGKGFIAALDQSGGSTPKTLALYGIDEKSYSNEGEMYGIVHEMRSRVILSPAFSSEYVLGAILFEDTMNRKIDGIYTADFLWEKKGIVPFLKVDKGLAPLQNGVQLMKPMPALAELLKEAKEKNIFGTKMRSFIQQADQQGIQEVVKQQFDVARQIAERGLVPIIEPEVDIHSEEKAEAEKILKEEIKKQLSKLESSAKVMLKISIPSQSGFYSDLMSDEHMIRIVALSGGYSQKEANEKLAANKGLIASFSRTLLFGLTAGQTDAEFNQTLENSLKSIYQASIT